MDIEQYVTGTILRTHPELTCVNAGRFRKAGYQAIDRICDYYYSLEQRPVVSQVQPGYLRDALPGVFDRIRGSRVRSWGWLLMLLGSYRKRTGEGRKLPAYRR